MSNSRLIYLSQISIIYVYIPSKYIRTQVMSGPLSLLNYSFITHKNYVISHSKQCIDKIRGFQLGGISVVFITLTEIRCNLVMPLPPPPPIGRIQARWRCGQSSVGGGTGTHPRAPRLQLANRTAKYRLSPALPNNSANARVIFSHPNPPLLDTASTILALSFKAKWRPKKGQIVLSRSNADT